MNPWTRASIALACAALLGCPSASDDGDEVANDASSTDSTNTTNDDNSTHGPDIFGPCECYNSPAECSAEELNTAVRDCSGGPTCVIEGLCPGTSPDNCGPMGECTEPLVYSGDIDCALEALRDRTQAKIVIREQNFLGFAACGVYYGDTHTVVHARATGRIPQIDCTQSDTGGVSWNYAFSQLEDASYFDACAAMMDESERFTCVMAGLTEPEELSDCTHQGG